MLPTDNPLAAPKAQVRHGKARFTVLTDRLIRMEWAADGRFEDRPTLSVVNRRLPVPAFTMSAKGASLRIATDAVELTFTDTGKGFTPRTLSARFRTAGVRGDWRFGQRDADNLGGTFRTLDGFDGDRKKEWKQNAAGKWEAGDWKGVPLPPGLVSRAGWSVFDDSNGIVLDPVAGKGTPWVTPRPAGKRQDLYFMAYGHDYRAWVRDASRVFGRQPLPPRFALGYWYSRYWAYTDRELEALVDEFRRNQVPLDVLVIDMDWHKPGWTGYSWDRDYFPDAAETLGHLKREGLKITLNLHPAQGVGEHEDSFRDMLKALGSDPKRVIRDPVILNDLVICKRRIAMDMTDPDYVRAYFTCLHHPLEKMGVDFWWMDWQQGTKTNVPGLDPLPWINHLHWTDMAANRERAGKRPICFSRFGGVGAGRYPIGFSGDTVVSWESLAFQPRFTATAANVLYGYWSHDIGGHMHNPITPELHARWVQFGAFSPVVRTHSTKSHEQDRRFWNFPEPYRGVMMQAVRDRYALVPYLYSECRRCFDTGLSLARPLYYHHPEDPEAYRRPNEYYLGEAVLAAPVVQPADKTTGLASVAVWLPRGRWFEVSSGRWFAGGRTHRLSVHLAETPHFVRPGAILPGQEIPERLMPGSYPALRVTAFPGGDGAYDLYEDDGVSEDYRTNRFATLPIRQESAGHVRRVVLEPARGTFKGFRPTRSLEVRLPASAPAVSVKINGRPLAWRFRPAANGWSYDGDTATLIIRVRRMDARKRTVVEVRTDPRIPAARLDGLAGLMRRLQEVMDLAKLVSPCWPLHAEERLATHVAQTGNRISRRPDTAAAELRALQAALRRLPRVLREFRGIYVKREKKHAAETLAKASAILAATLRDF
jgi:alpha-glucosidase